MPSPSPLQWLSLIGTIWLQSFNGANSDFSVYSSQLKHLLSISQVQLNNLAFASDAGKLFGWLAGVAAIYIPLWLVLVAGAAFGLVGYGVQFLFIANGVPSLSYWHVFMLTALAGNGICWINTVCYLICIQNFPSDSRVAVGLSTSYVGLSAKLYTVVADVIFHPRSGGEAKAYLLLNAIAPVAVTTIAAPLLRVAESKNQRRSGYVFIAIFSITLATGVCAVVSSISSASINLSSREYMLSLGVLLAAPLLIPAVTSLRDNIEEMRWNKRERRIHDLTADDAGTGGIVAEDEVKDERAAEGDGTLENEEVRPLSMLKKVDFWLYFFTYMFGATLGLVFSNNLGQIAESRGLFKTSSLVSLSSSFGFFGRLMPSLLDYYLSESGYMVSRSASIATLMAPMAGAFFLLLNPSNISLYISTTIIGACTGSITSIAVSATPELFGLKNFGVNHNIVVGNIPIGSFLFGYLAALLYQRGEQGDGRCFGAKCYHKTFIIWGCTCSVGTLLCIVLYIRTRKRRSGAINQVDSS